jgi:ribosomal-protein-alanine N-acetyltransferase
MPIELAAARVEDAPALARIARESFGDPWSEAAFVEELARPRTRAWLAREAGSDTIGYVLGWVLEDRVEIQSLAVAPAWRRRGLGRRLLEALLGQARRDGMREAWLEVRASNEAARRLYEGLGFVRQGERPGYYAGGEAALLLGAAL